MAYSLGGQSLGNITRDYAKKTSGAVVLPSFYEDADKTEVIEMSGPIREFTVEGIYTATSTATLTTFIDAIEGFIDGQQDTTVSYVSDLRGTINVKVLDFDSDWVEGRPSAVPYTIKLVEAIST